MRGEKGRKTVGPTGNDRGLEVKSKADRGVDWSAGGKVSGSESKREKNHCLELLDDVCLLSCCYFM